MKRLKSLLVLAALLSLVGVVAVKALVPIDTFNDTVQTSDVGATACTSASTPGIDVIAIERDILVTRTAGSGTVVAEVDGSVTDQFALSIGASTRGTALIQWDGVDGACTLNPTGLGGVNLLPDDGMAIHVTSVDLNAVLTVNVYSDAVNFSTYSYVIPDSVSSPGYIMYFPFDGFTVGGGTGADYTNVGAIELLVDGTGVDSLDVTIDFVNSDFTRDFGDLPAAYNNITLLANNGARHIPATVYFGAAVDTDADGLTSADATGDNVVGADEDGVSVSAGRDWGTGSGDLIINSTFPAAETVACVVGWIDWDNSGSFDVGGTTGGELELVFNNFVFPGSSTPTITTPTNADYGGTYPPTLNARWRIFERNADIFTTLSIPVDPFGCPTVATEAQMAALLTGQAHNGEVEDYQWGFGPNAVEASAMAGSANFGVVAMVMGVVATAGAVVLRKRK